MEVSNCKVVYRHRLIQFNELNLINRQVTSISLLEFVAYLKFICEDPPFAFNPKRMVVCRLDDLLSNMQFNNIITLVAV